LTVTTGGVGFEPEIGSILLPLVLRLLESAEPTVAGDESFEIRVAAAREGLEARIAIEGFLKFEAEGVSMLESALEGLGGFVRIQGGGDEEASLRIQFPMARSLRSFLIVEAAGQRIALLGPDAVSLGGSEYLWTLHGRLAGRLAPLDLEVERRVQSAVRAAVGAGLVTAAHDCAEGGLAVTLAEAAVTGPRANGGAGVGCEVTVEPGRRLDETLFGEGPSRVVVTVEPGRQREFEALMAESAIPWRWIGTTAGERLSVRASGRVVVDVPVDRIEHAWRSGFERHMA